MSYYEHEQIDKSYVNHYNKNNNENVFSPKLNYTFESKHGLNNDVKNTDINNSYINNTKETNNNSYISTGNKSTVSMYLDRRHRQSQEKLSKLKQEIYTAENRNMTFKPKISEKSKKIVKKLISNLNNDTNNNSNNLIHNSNKPIIIRNNSNYNNIPNFNNKSNKDNKEKPVVIKHDKDFLANAGQNYVSSLRDNCKFYNNSCLDMNTNNKKYNKTTTNYNNTSVCADNSFNNKIDNLNTDNVNNSCFVKYDPVQEDYKKIINRRIDIMQQKNNIFNTTKITRSISCSNKSNKASFRSSTQHTKKLYNSKINKEFKDSSLVNSNKSQNQNIIYPNYPLYEDPYNSIKPIDYGKPNYNIFQAQPIDKIVDARNNLGIFYNKYNANKTYNKENTFNKCAAKTEIHNISNNLDKSKNSNINKYSNDKTNQSLKIDNSINNKLENNIHDKNLKSIQCSDNVNASGSTSLYNTKFNNKVNIKYSNTNNCYSNNESKSNRINQLNNLKEFATNVKQNNNILIKDNNNYNDTINNNNNNNFNNENNKLCLTDNDYKSFVFKYSDNNDILSNNTTTNFKNYQSKEVSKILSNKKHNDINNIDINKKNRNNIFDITNNDKDFTLGNRSYDNTNNQGDINYIENNSTINNDYEKKYNNNYCNNSDILKKNEPNYNTDNNQYKLDCSSKEYLFKKLNQMRNLKSNN